MNVFLLTYGYINGYIIQNITPQTPMEETSITQDKEITFGSKVTAQDCVSRTERYAVKYCNARNGQMDEINIETDYDKMINCPVAENCAWEKTSIGMEVPGVYGTWTYEELKECIDATRDAYIENNYEYDSPGTLVVEMEDNLIIRIYTVSS